MRLLAAYHLQCHSEEINEDQEQQQSPVLPAANQAPLLQEGNSPVIIIRSWAHCHHCYQWHFGGFSDKNGEMMKFTRSVTVALAPSSTCNKKIIELSRVSSQWRKPACLNAEMEDLDILTNKKTPKDTWDNVFNLIWCWWFTSIWTATADMR